MASRARLVRLNAPTMTFSSTVMLSNERTTWNVRAIPGAGAGERAGAGDALAVEADFTAVGGDLAGDGS